MGVVAGDNRFDPFLLFPEEVWKQILEKLKDTTDVLNMFTAYPEMKNLLVTTRHLYLFDLILPYVADWVNEEVILNCRQVCKHWYNAVNHLVENQPSLRAYGREAQLHCQNWNPRYKFKASNETEMEDPSLYLFRRYFRWRYSFHNQLIIQAFINDFQGFPQDSNPFIGRSVVINRYPWGNHKYAISFWDNALTLIRGWGKHIWFLEVWEFLHQEPYHFAQCIQQCLHLCPNLRSIYLEGNMSWTSDNEGQGEAQKRVSAISDFVFPYLPHLETLKFGDGYPELIDTLIRRYSSQVRRLVWSTRSRNWKEEYGELFPNLTEFILAVPTEHNDEVSRVIMSMKCPKLYRLYLGFRGKWNHSPADEEIGNWKKHFPNLSVEHFGINCKLF